MLYLHAKQVSGCVPLRIIAIHVMGPKYLQILKFCIFHIFSIVFTKLTKPSSTYYSDCLIFRVNTKDMNYVAIDFNKMTKLLLFYTFSLIWACRNLKRSVAMQDETESEKSKLKTVNKFVVFFIKYIKR